MWHFLKKEKKNGKHKRFNHEIIGVLLKVPRSWTKEIKQDLNVGVLLHHKEHDKFLMKHLLALYCLDLFATKRRFGNRKFDYFSKWSGNDCCLCCYFVELELNFLFIDTISVVYYLPCAELYFGINHWHWNIGIQIQNQMNISINNVLYCCVMFKAM